MQLITVAYLCLEANHMDIIEMENTEMLLKAQHQHPQVATKIDIEFNDLVYRVKQPRSKGEFVSDAQFITF